MKQTVPTNIILFFVVIAFLSTCGCSKKQTSPEVRINEVIINNEGQFTYESGLTYAVIDSVNYQINITTEPQNAEVYYSKNGGGIRKKTTDWITIDSSTKYISFFSNSEGYCMTDGNRLDFGFGNDSLIKDLITISPNPTADSIHIQLNSKTRGLLQYSIYNVVGQELMSHRAFILSNDLQQSVNLSTLNQGVYILQIKYGNTTINKKIVKQL